MLVVADNAATAGGTVAFTGLRSSVPRVGAYASVSGAALVRTHSSTNDGVTTAIPNLPRALRTACVLRAMAVGVAMSVAVCMAVSVAVRLVVGTAMGKVERGAAMAVEATAAAAARVVVAKVVAVTAAAVTAAVAMD